MKRFETANADGLAGNATGISPEWVSFFTEARRLAALARTRRAAAMLEASGGGEGTGMSKN